MWITFSRIGAHVLVRRRVRCNLRLGGQIVLGGDYPIHDLAGAVCRAIIDSDNFVIGIFER
jgi:hypothetical protein